MKLQDVLWPTGVEHLPFNQARLSDLSPVEILLL